MALIPLTGRSDYQLAIDDATLALHLISVTGAGVATDKGAINLGLGASGLAALNKIAPPNHAAVVTPNDGADLANDAQVLVVAVAGDIKVTTTGGEAVTIPFPAGWTPIEVERVWATGTTATGITALWN